MSWVLLWSPSRVYAQCTNPPDCIQNPGFTINNGTGDVNDLVLPGWYVSHITPTLMGGPGSQDPYSVWMWSYSGFGEAIYTCFNFRAGHTYRICIDMRCDNNYATHGIDSIIAINAAMGGTGAYFFIQASNGNLAYPTNPGCQVIARDFIVNPNWRTYTYTFTPTANYGYLWLFPYMSIVSNEHINWDAYRMQIDNVHAEEVVDPVLGLVYDTPFSATLSISPTPSSPGRWRWTVPPGAVIGANADSSQITVAGCGNIPCSARFESSCGICSVYALDTVVRITTPFNVDLGPDTTVCAHGHLELHNLMHVPGIQYRWPDGSTGGTFAPSSSGTYWVTASLSNCTASDTVHVVVEPSPVVHLGPDRPLCPGQTFTLDATSPGAVYLWQDNSTGATYHVTREGTYSVTATLGNCSVSGAVTVTAAPDPVFSLGSRVAVCAGTPVILDATVQNATYQWHNGAVTATFKPSQSGRYWVKVTLGPCSVTDSVDVTFNPLPSVHIAGNSTKPCTGTTVVLDATQPGLAYRWPDGSTLPTYTVTQSGTYAVEVTDTAGCRNTAATTVTYLAPPLFAFTDSVLCYGDTWGLDITAQDAVYLWQDKSVSPVFTVTHAGTYWGMAANACGSHADTVEIGYRRCNCGFFVPDSFTPDRDGQNEIFTPVSNEECPLTDYTFTVFNRWGGVIFETGNPEYGWDGTVKGRPAPLGVYVYRLLYKFDKTPLLVRQGNIILVR